MAGSRMEFESSAIPAKQFMKAAELLCCVPACSTTMNRPVRTRMQYMVWGAGGNPPGYPIMPPPVCTNNAYCPSSSSLTFLRKSRICG